MLGGAAVVGGAVVVLASGDVGGGSVEVGTEDVVIVSFAESAGDSVATRTERSVSRIETAMVATAATAAANASTRRAFTQRSCAVRAFHARDGGRAPRGHPIHS